MKLRITAICVLFLHCLITGCAPKNNTCNLASRKVMEEMWIGAHSTESIDRAISLCLDSANEGNVTAQFYLSMFYALKNNKQENEESYKWTLKAAKNGHIDSQFHLGVMYEKGIVVKQDSNKAEEWYQRAAQNGSLLAQKKLIKEKGSAPIK